MLTWKILQEHFDEILFDLGSIKWRTLILQESSDLVPKCLGRFLTDENSQTEGWQIFHFAESESTMLRERKIE
jgi:hypothetical protein